MDVTNKDLTDLNICSANGRVIITGITVIDTGRTRGLFNKTKGSEAISKVKCSQDLILTALLAIFKATSLVKRKPNAAFLTDFLISASYPSTPAAIASLTTWKKNQASITVDIATI